MSDNQPIDRFCPKCISNRVYVDDDFLACRTCGNRWIPNYTPYKKVEEDEGMPKAKLDLERIKTLISDGKSVPEIIKETGYKINSVRSAMNRLGLKCKKDGRGSNRQIKKLSPDKIKKTWACRTLGVKQSFGDSDMSGLITSINIQIKHHQDAIEKLERAKQILL